MSLTLQHLWPLALILPFAALLLLLKRRSLCLLLAPLFLILAATQPTLTWTTQPHHILLLLDLSALSRGTPLRDPQFIRTLAQKNLPPQTHLTILGISKTSSILLDDIALDDLAHWPTQWPERPTDYPADRAAALAWRLPNNPDIPCWLLTTTTAPPIPPAAGLAVTRLQNTHEDYAISDIKPRSNALFVHVNALLSDQNPLPIPHFLKITTGNLELGQVPITQARDQWIAFPTPKPSVATRYDIELYPHTDLWPENDHASILLTPPDMAQVVTLDKANQPKDLAQLLDAGIQTVAVPKDLKISRQTAEILGQFVREAGGSILLPRNNLGLKDISPLSPENPDRDTVHIVFLLDGSGSMNENASGEPKMRVAGRAILGVAGLFSPRDRIGIYIFNNATTLFVEGSSDNLRRAIASGLPEATGGSELDSALPVLGPVLQDRKLKTVFILLTDGDLPRVDVQAWQWVTKDVPFLIVAPKTVSEPFQKLEAGAKVASTDDPSEWEVLLRQLVSDEFQAKRRSDRLSWRMKDLTGETTNWEELYPIDGAEVRVTGRDDSGKEWAAGAVVQRGLGKVAATSFDASQPLVDQLLRDISPPPSDPRYVMKMEGGRVLVDALDVETHRFLDREALTIRVISDDNTRDYELIQTGPGHYETTVEGAGAQMVVLMKNGDFGEKTRVLGRISPAEVADGGGADFPASVPTNGAQTIENAGDTVGTLEQRHRMGLAMGGYVGCILAVLAYLWGNVKMGKI